MLVKQTNCRLCSSPDFVKILDFGSTALANNYRDHLMDKIEKYPLEVYLCNECGSVQLGHTVNPKILFQNYFYQSSHSKGLVDHFEKYAKDIIDDYELGAESVVVDIGGNCGVLAKPFRDFGCIAINVEPAKNLSQVSRDNGVITINEFFNETVAKDIVSKFGNADIVTSNNCFAHIDNLHEIIRGIKVLLKPDGHFVFENAYWLESVANNYFDQAYHEHIYYHSIKPLKRLLNSHGLYITKVSFNQIQGGSFRIECSPNKAFETNVDSIIKEEQDAGLYLKSTYENWLKRISKIGDNLRNYLAGAQLMGIDVAAYGVPAKATTLLNVLGIGKYIKFCIDDSPLKIGKYLPDQNIQIISSDEWKKQNPPVTLVLAWNFADAIMSKNSDYSSTDGTFIVPLPQIEFVY